MKAFAGNQPAPVVVVIVLGPIEVRIAIGIDVREIRVAIRIDPRGYVPGTICATAL
jgi:hypothetical protein